MNHDSLRDLDRLGAPASPPASANSAFFSAPVSPWRSGGYLDKVVESWKRELSWIENLPSTDPGRSSCATAFPATKTPAMAPRERRCHTFLGIRTSVYVHR